MRISCLVSQHRFSSPSRASIQLLLSRSSRSDRLRYEHNATEFNKKNKIQTTYACECEIEKSTAKTLKRDGQHVNAIVIPSPKRGGERTLSTWEKRADRRRWTLCCCTASRNLSTSGSICGSVPKHVRLQTGSGDVRRTRE